MSTYRTKSITVEALQVNWKNFHALGEFIPGVINEDNPTRQVSEALDTCGEDGPYLEFSLTLSDRTIKVSHGAWIIRHEDGRLASARPQSFKMFFEPAEGVPEPSLDELEHAVSRKLLEGILQGHHSVGEYQTFTGAMIERKSGGTSKLQMASCDPGFGGSQSSTVEWFAVDQPSGLPVPFFGGPNPGPEVLKHWGVGGTVTHPDIR